MNLKTAKRRGRPSSGKVKIIVSLEPEMLKRIDLIAKAQTRTRSQAIQHLIKIAVTDEPS